MIQVVLPVFMAEVGRAGFARAGDETSPRVITEPVRVVFRFPFPGMTTVTTAVGIIIMTL